MSTIFDLTKLGLEEGTYNISARAKASGYVDSNESNVIAYEVSHKLSGTWIFNDNLSLPQSAIKSNLSFTSNGELFAYGMVLSATAIEFYYGIYTPLFVFQSGNWVNENYKTVKFEGEQKVSKEFYDCFIQNARKYKMITFTIDGTTYQAEEGMTWSEWVSSVYNTDGFYIGTSLSFYPVILNGERGLNENGTEDYKCVYLNNTKMIFSDDTIFNGVAYMMNVPATHSGGSN